MKRHWILILVTALLFAVVLSPVYASPVTMGDAPTISSYALSCSGGSASGSSTAPYVAIFVTSFHHVTKPAILEQVSSAPIKQPAPSSILDKPFAGIPFDHMVIVPVVDGLFSGGMSIPELPEGTPVLIQVFPVDSLEYPFPIGGSWHQIEACKLDVAPHPEVGYELRVMICDTPVYGSPAGAAVTGASVTIGQTFYANPVDTIAADGTHWTQFFDGAWTYPYLPSVCVQ